MSTVSPTAVEARPGSYAAARPRPPRQVALEGLVGRGVRGFEVAFSIVAILLLSGAFLPLYIRESGGSVVSAGSVPLLRNMAIAIYLVTVPLALIRHREVMAALRRHLPTIALLGLVMLSVAWSADAGTTLQRGVALMLTTLFGVYLAARFELSQLLRVLAAALGIGAVLSVLMVLAVPSWGLDRGDHAGDWRGIYSHKNSLAEIMVLSSIIHLLLWRGTKERRGLYLAGGLLSAGLVVMSSSKTALGVLVTLVALSLLYRSIRWSYTVAVPLLAGCVLVVGGIGVLALANTEAIFTALGKDPTLTGRTPMWLAIIDMIERRPLLGYGYSAFWGGLESASAPVLLRIGWNTPHAHNGFLDILLQLGVVGMLVFLFALFTAARNGVRMVRADHGSVALWPLLFLSFLVLYNITETTVLQQNNVYWSFYAATVFAWMAPSWVRRQEALAEPETEDVGAEEWSDPPGAELGTRSAAERYASDRAT